MALNIKTAMLLCMAAVGAVSWVVQQVEPPQVHVDSPLVLADVRAELAKVVGLPELTRPERRTEWARQFARPNPLDEQATANRTSHSSLAWQPPTEPSAGELILVALPPLAYQESPAVAEGGEDPSVLNAESGLAAGGPEGTPVTMAAATPAELKRCRIAKGDTLSKIAQREWGSRDPRLIRLLAEVNPKVVRNDRVRLGDELLIPDRATAQRVLAGERPAGGAGDAVELVSAAGDSKTAAAEWYTIRKHDTLQSIAERCLKDARRWREIVALNRTLDPHRIVPGTKIKLPRLIRLAQT